MAATALLCVTTVTLRRARELRRSRASLLTGRRPDTTQVLENGKCPFTTDPRHKDWVSLPQYFRNHGFTTAGMGKIYHVSASASSSGPQARIV